MCSYTQHHPFSWCSYMGLCLWLLGETLWHTLGNIRVSTYHRIQIRCRSQQLQPCWEQLSSLIATQPAQRLPEGGCPISHHFQWLGETYKLRKDLLETICQHLPWLFHFNLKSKSLQLHTKKRAFAVIFIKKFII